MGLGKRLWLGAAVMWLAACGADPASAPPAGSGSTDAGSAADSVIAACQDGACPADSHCVVQAGAANCLCDAGYVRVGSACIASTFVQEQCRLSCLELAACGKGDGKPSETCQKACVASAADANAFAKTACTALNYEHDGLWCGVLSACDKPASGDGCAASCAAKQKCGFLAKPGITSGTSLAECEVLCRAYDTVYTHLKTADAYAACLQKATASCDPHQLALCEAYNGADLCANVCGWLGGAKYCNYIPGRWSDEAACQKQCSAWTPKQANAVFGCYNKLNFAGCNTQKALDCFDPPSELPAGVSALTAAVAGVCPDVVASADPGVNAWHFLGRTLLWPDWMQDSAAALDCIKAVKSCPSHYDFDWLASCFTSIAPDVAAACNTAQQCLINSGTKAAYLTIDGTTTLDGNRCKVAWQSWKGKDPSGFAGVAACLSKVNGSDCSAVNACIAGGNPVGAACNELVECWGEAGANPYGLPAMDGGMCAGLLEFGQDPAVTKCVNQAKDCAARNACLPIKAVAPNAVAACTLLVPCWDAAKINPFSQLGKLTIGTCAAATSVYNSKSPGVADMIFGCLQGAADCSARLACLPQQ
jgi:hypothetical protein